MHEARQKLVKWLVDAGLYKALKLSEQEALQLAESISSIGVKMDCYCPGCERESVFTWGTKDKLSAPMPITLSSLHRTQPESEFSRVLGYLSRVLEEPNFSCARLMFHQLRFFMNVNGDEKTGAISITKIGQFPSHFDLLSEELQGYGKILDAPDLKELRSADICTSSGYHIAAFTYLRRVFERRLEIAHVTAQKDSGWNEETYVKAYFMEDRIEMLRHHLPQFLVEHRKLYNVLSRGIHELTEEECADGFEVSRLGVTLILDEEIERRARATKIKGAGPSIQKLHEKLKK